MTRHPWAAVFLALAGCPDPDAALDDFVAGYCEIPENRETKPLCGGTAPGLGAACTPAVAGELDGDYLLALTPVQSPTKPAPFEAAITTLAGADGVEISLTLFPIDADDRITPVPATLGPYGPFPIDAGGVFTAQLGTVTVPAETNPISDFALTADVALEGQACAGATSLCGVAHGTITDPVTLALDGSTWAMSPIVEGTIAEPPPINCAGDPADPL